MNIENKSTTWKEYKKTANISPEQQIEIKFEKDIIRDTIKSRKTKK